MYGMPKLMYLYIYLSRNLELSSPSQFPVTSNSFYFIHKYSSRWKRSDGKAYKFELDIEMNKDLFDVDPS